MSRQNFIKKPYISPMIFGVTDKSHQSMAKVCYSFLPIREVEGEQLLFSESAFRRDGSLVTLDDIFTELENKGNLRWIDENGSETNWVKYNADVSWGVGLFYDAISSARQNKTAARQNETAVVQIDTFKRDVDVQKVLLTYDLPQDLKTKLDEVGYDFEKFFEAKDSGDHAKFKDTVSVQLLLDFIGGKLEKDQNKTDKTRLPFSDTRLRDILNHIVFVMPNLQAVDAMYNIIRKTPYNDPNIETPNDWIKRRFSVNRVNNANGKFDDIGLEHVRKGMNGEWSNKGQHANEGKDCLSSRTLTIVCDDITKTKNPPEWNGLFVFKNFESFDKQLNLFNAINKSWIVSDTQGNSESMKPECFMFDFTLDRTLKQLTESKTLSEIDRLLEDTAIFAYDGVQTKIVDSRDILNLVHLGAGASGEARKWELTQIAKVKKGYKQEKFAKTFEYKVVYIFRINDKAHHGLLKIGDATIDGIEDMAQLVDSSPLLHAVANKRIKQYTQTAGVDYELLYTTLAVDYQLQMFRDYDVHNVLTRSGIEKVKLSGGANEWFRVDLETAKTAVQETKNGKKSLDTDQITTANNPISFRPEQLYAIRQTLKQFANFKKEIKQGQAQMLWNAKMRFGKTLTSLQVARELNFKKTIIATHRPVVSSSWFEDFNKIFFDKTNFKFGSKINGESLESLLKYAQSGGHFVYFASIQDLRGSGVVGGKHEKNEELFEVDWDYLIIDEAHEGTQTKLGYDLIRALTRHNTKRLYLSGTPFSLIKGYKEDEIFTWDYVMEQRAKKEWAESNSHFGDSNPYESLPQLNIFTYDLNKEIKGFESIEDDAFNFKEFFRTWTGDPDKDKKEIPENIKIGDFVHKDYINNFLNLLCKENESNFPFSTAEYQENFRHTLWMVPGVREARAMSALLKDHAVFGSGDFRIVNVAGDGDSEEEIKNALKVVEESITQKPEQTRTITLSCGRLTAGVTVPAWTAVLMLAGSYSTSAANYLQTIFRVQSPANIGGKIKTNCFVFDFAPDRTLSMVAEVASLSLSKKGSGDKSKLGEFLNFCPVIAICGGAMKPYSAETMLTQMKKTMIDRVARNGFEDKNLYNYELLVLNSIEITRFQELKKIIGANKASKNSSDIEINSQGFDTEVHEHEPTDLEKKPKAELTPEEKVRLEKLKEERKARSAAISILHGISIRIPLLVFGAEIDESKEDNELSINNLTNIVDDNSWAEFMPKGVTKELFNEFRKYYDDDIFVAVSKNIRRKAKAADNLTIEERISTLADIFATFKNPDKETVLTPWRVVNMHLGDTIGGYNFFEDDKSKRIDIEGVKKPRLIEYNSITDEVFTPDTKILEINSKTGLYPLYVAYSCLQFLRGRHGKTKSSQSLWQEILDKNIFVIARTQMAKMITNRTLRGFKSYSTNIMVYEDILQDMKDDLASQKTKRKTNKTISRIVNPKKWNKEGAEMKFDAVIGNPPYQENFAHREEQPPVYHLFYDAAHALGQKATLITPARFLWKVGKTPAEWNEKMLADKHFKIVQCFMKSTDVFESVDIKGGVAYGYYDKAKDFGAIGTFSHNSEVKDIMQKVIGVMGYGLDSILFSQGSYKYSELFYKENPNLALYESGNFVPNIKTNAFERFSEIFFENKPSNRNKYIQILGLLNNKRIWRYIDIRYIKPPKNFEKYKLFLPKANGSGALGEVLSSPMLGLPMQGHSQTFISLGSFDTNAEAENLLKYIKTKFARIMLGTKKVTQDNSSKTVWSNVPLQDFEQNSDIDWVKSIVDIDKQLYAKYKFSKEQIDFVEKSVTEMK